jgi:hypothetical protein
MSLIAFNAIGLIIGPESQPTLLARTGAFK